MLTQNIIESVFIVRFNQLIMNIIHYNDPDIATTDNCRLRYEYRLRKIMDLLSYVQEHSYLLPNINGTVTRKLHQLHNELNRVESIVDDDHKKLIFNARIIYRDILS